MTVLEFPGGVPRIPFLHVRSVDDLQIGDGPISQKWSVAAHTDRNWVTLCMTFDKFALVLSTYTYRDLSHEICLTNVLHLYMMTSVLSSALLVGVSSILLGEPQTPTIQAVIQRPTPVSNPIRTRIKSVMAQCLFTSELTVKVRRV